MNLVWTAMTWQVFSIGAVGLIFKVSSLFSNVISTLGLPIVPVLAVFIFQDKSGLKAWEEEVGSKVTPKVGKPTMDASKKSVKVSNPQTHHGDVVSSNCGQKEDVSPANHANTIG
ncbi:unnamed protein product [Ilex paraguariensis]|uniref:Uncharacterized protein n=1 Tax=Ilex paraguariensis TaxID=185542 RepID=A0ABC8RPE4_9AQUA